MADVKRRAARGLLLTSDREVLLMRMAFPWVATPIWIAPGGGLEAGERWEDALVRELREETGLCVASVGPLIWERTIQIEHRGDITHLHERYFLVATPRFEPVSTCLEHGERGWFQEFRWWPLTALSTCQAVDAGQTIRTILERNVESGSPAP
jgi:8-oxo-dGTP pyrophosphatase MutT (NUDIX family)